MYYRAEICLIMYRKHTQLPNLYTESSYYKHLAINIYKLSHKKKSIQHIGNTSQITYWKKA